MQQSNKCSRGVGESWHGDGLYIHSKNLYINTQSFSELGLDAMCRQ